MPQSWRGRFSKRTEMRLATEAQDTSRDSRSDANPSDANIDVAPPSSDAASPIKVHLVRENVTQTLSLEDYVAGVLRGEGTVESEAEALKALAITIRTYALKNTRPSCNTRLRLLFDNTLSEVCWQRPDRDEWFNWDDWFCG